MSHSWRAAGQFFRFFMVCRCLIGTNLKCTLSSRPLAFAAIVRSGDSSLRSKQWLASSVLPLPITMFPSRGQQ
jgi:hypothetical protein